MRIGTKSLLFGCHQFVLHPVMVGLAWWRLYGRPTLPEAVAIVIHDWGYWNQPNMDGPEGEEHPIWAYDRLLEFAVKRRSRVVPWCDAAMECRFHSRYQAWRFGWRPRRLCYADKLGTAMMPWPLYCLLGSITGEIREFSTARKHELYSARGLGAREFFWRYRGIVWRILRESWEPRVRRFARSWRPACIEYGGPLNA